jgi:glycosyltransferase involved in cell wall biosynthesis
VVHSDPAVDPAEQRPIYERAVFDRWAARSAATVTYSNYVATMVAGRRDVRGTPVYVVPPTSDLDAALVPSLVGPDGRHDFVMIGRLNADNSIDVVLESWQRHLTNGNWRGDELVLIGDGPLVIRSLPAFVRWRPGKFRHSDAVTTLAHAKASILHYHRASQSAMQLLSMQLGVMPIVSRVGDLPEYQPPNYPPIGVDDIAALATAFDELADPFTATLHGAAAARHYEQRFAPHCLADRLLDLIEEVLAGSRVRPRATASTDIPGRDG